MNKVDEYRTLVHRLFDGEITPKELRLRAPLFRFVYRRRDRQTRIDFTGGACREEAPGDRAAVMAPQREAKPQKI